MGRLKINESGAIVTPVYHSACAIDNSYPETVRSALISTCTGKDMRHEAIEHDGKTKYVYWMDDCECK